MNLKKITIILVKNILFLNFVRCDQMNNINQQITQNLALFKPHQVTTFISEKAENSSLKVPIVHDYPKMILSFGNSTLTMEAQILHWDSFAKKSPLRSSLIIFQSNSPDESESFIDFLIQFLPAQSRPKCLFVFTGNISNVKIGKILKYGWEIKFLDFSIVTIDTDEDSTFSKIYEFNPFYKRLNYKNLTENTQIFPEKLQNGNGYPIRLAKVIPYFHPSLMVEKKGKLIKKYDYVERRIDLIFSIMNFSVIKKIGGVISFYEMIYEWNTNLFAFTFPPSNYDSNFLVPTDEPGLEYYAFVPILASSGKITTFSTIIYNMIVIVAVSLVLIYTSKLLEVAKDNLGVFNIVRIISGQSVKKTPRCIASRIIYLAIVSTYVKLISFDLYDTIIKVKFESTEVPCESYKDLDELNFDMYTPYSSIKMAISDDQNLRNIMHRTHVIDDITKCFDKLIESKNVTCAAHEGFSYEIIERNKKFERPVIKIAKPSIFGEFFKFYKFETASPFGNKFAMILRRTQETGLNWMTSLKHRFDHTVHLEKESMKLDDKIDIKQLLLLLFCGYFLAIYTFISEFIVFEMS